MGAITKMQCGHVSIQRDPDIELLNCKTCYTCKLYIYKTGRNLTTFWLNVYN